MDTYSFLKKTFFGDYFFEITIISILLVALTVATIDVTGFRYDIELIFLLFLLFFLSLTNFPFLVIRKQQRRLVILEKIKTVRAEIRRSKRELTRNKETLFLLKDNHKSFEKALQGYPEKDSHTLATGKDSLLEQSSSLCFQMAILRNQEITKLRSLRKKLRSLNEDLNSLR